MMNISYNWIKKYIKELPEPHKLGDLFTYHLCEVEGIEEKNGDTVFELNILPNRAHDLLSHQGVAREIASQLGVSFSDDIQNLQTPQSVPTKLSIDIQTDACRRYSARIIRNVTVGPSPAWMVALLESIGQRSINNIVDATNFVMFDIGQPTHAFDLAKLTGEKIIIRAAQENEALTTLDAKSVLLKESDAVISDEARALAIAGVKGGTAAEVDEDTTDIVIEVANFAPAATRKSARRLGILTDSAKRFENDLSPELAGIAMQKLSSLISKLCPAAEFEDIVDSYPTPQEKRVLTFSLSRVNTLLGVEISETAAEMILNAYHFAFEKNGDLYTIVVPPLRLDLEVWQDMAEELGRIYGYEKIEPKLPQQRGEVKENDVVAKVRAARQQLAQEGYAEVYTYSFTKKGAIEVARGAKGKEFLRTNLADGIKLSYELNRLNAPLLGVRDIKIFEIGAVFPSKDTEEIHIATADKKGIKEYKLEEFTSSLSNIISSTEVSSHPFHAWSLFPFITRDVAVWVPVGSEKMLEKIVSDFAHSTCVRPAELFDQFEKEGRKSFAYRFVFQAPDRTLTDTEVNSHMESLYTALRAQEGFEVR
jgi:phenylalanyl-tRNA synthetase beta chain